MIALPLLAQGEMAAGFGLDWLITLILAAICIPVYGRLALRVMRGEGKVYSASYGMPDFLFVMVLGGWALLAAVSALKRGGESQPMTVQGIYESAVMFGIIVLVIALFLSWRKLPIGALFGLAPERKGRLLGKAVLYCLASYPLVLLTMVITQSWLGNDGSPQTIIKFFEEALLEGRGSEIIATVFTAAVVAPVVEEFIFRGYFYGTFRHYIGPLGAMVVTSLLFAAIHLNLLALPGLFVLALCFSLAYEATGSLLVPIVMHAIFNASNLVFVFLNVRTQ